MSKNKYNLVAKYKNTNVKLIDEVQVITPKDLRKIFPSEKLIVCDNLITGNFKLSEFGYTVDDILCVDHHANSPEFEKAISSTNFANRYVKKRGIVSNDTFVIITHTDTDSILSSLIITGVLPPEDRFVEAAVISDHIGNENEIVDLLSSLKRERDVEFSVRNLELYLNNEAIEAKAKKLLDEQMRNRKISKELVEQGKVKKFGKVALVITEEKLESSILAPFLPEAVIVLVARPWYVKKWYIKTRLGQSAPGGLTLHEVMKGLDPAYGGRWNAGNNKRAGGTDIEPEDYAKMINERLEKILK